ncbi:PREDICTED: agamous-like MADS-box protein AGL62 [Erythranthe guttata]|uniref:agamous-like MADS-box protein AGL62 n=1 Tax=Erythranthe guttata TaxID=4155 RepID=UPI00064D9799|nr:PREDICTED: agamous-like MADS-box protein AGL62 [Erythranthe guttata]|eukprot:XP_012851814.1 PREDICTED: agamous-like MADS-box protein AGL62 [Erythranthe guttata]
MAGRQTRGLIENQDDLYATFSKRRLGLYNKASELSTLCGVDIGIIIFSPTDNPFSFFHPSMESVIDRFRNPNQPLSDYARVVEAHTRARIDNLNRRLDEIHKEKDRLKEREKELDEIEGWWEDTPIESLSPEQVQEWKAWFRAFKAGEGPSGSGSGQFSVPYNFGAAQYGAEVPLAAAAAAGGSGGGGQFPPMQYNYFPPPPQQPDHDNQNQDPTSATVGEYSIQYNYIPRWGQDPSAGGGAGPSHRGNI